MLLLLSCKKSGDSNNSRCGIDKAVFNQQDTGTYLYSGSLLSKIYLPGGYYKFDYEKDKPIRISLFINPPVLPVVRHEIVYNTNGTLARIDYFKLVNLQAGVYNSYTRIVFSYTTDQLEKLEFYSVTNNVLELQADFKYTSNAGTIVSCHAKDYFPSIQETDITYTADNTLNSFKKKGPYAFLVDPLFMDIDPVLLPVAISKNNVTDISINGQPNPIRCVLNDLQDLDYFQVNGRTWGEYLYKCD